MERARLLTRLQDRLYDELETYAGSDIKNIGHLECIDKLTHAIKSISTVLAMEGYDQESSQGYGGVQRMRQYHPARAEYENGRSRGSDDEYMEMLMRLKTMAPDEQTAQTIQRMINDRR